MNEQRKGCTTHFIFFFMKWGSQEHADSWDDHFWHVLSIKTCCFLVKACESPYWSFYKQNLEWTFFFYGMRFLKLIGHVHFINIWFLILDFVSWSLMFFWGGWGYEILNKNCFGWAEPTTYLKIRMDEVGVRPRFNGSFYNSAMSFYKYFFVFMKCHFNHISPHTQIAFIKLFFSTGAFCINMVAEPIS